MKELLDLHSPECIALVYLAYFLKNGGSVELKGTLIKPKSAQKVIWTSSDMTDPNDSTH